MVKSHNLWSTCYFWSCANSQWFQYVAVLSEVGDDSSKLPRFEVSSLESTMAHAMQNTVLDEKTHRPIAFSPVQCMIGFALSSPGAWLSSNVWYGRESGDRTLVSPGRSERVLLSWEWRFTACLYFNGGGKTSYSRFFLSYQRRKRLRCILNLSCHLLLVKTIVVVELHPIHRFLSKSASSNWQHHNTRHLMT
ncbi:hypothetical protein BS47DRAFT_479563 [Hydnum rufescens UP504]|uniref:Uncharacterized protein n=1 Tax=Hydnum rufescens UP504 TaxID=1448309 RepID=A0A9P6AJD9_9AGAM|nr:hypothetical protein BS47DRAFT_479563 [Hydnum rufescens UP504]